MGITPSWLVAFCAVLDSKKALVYFRRDAVGEYLTVFRVNHALCPNFCEAVSGLFTPVQRQDIFLPGYGMGHFYRFTITGSTGGKMFRSDGN